MKATAQTLAALSEPLDDLVRTRCTRSFKRQLRAASLVSGFRDCSDFLRGALEEKVETARKSNPALFHHLASQ